MPIEKRSATLRTGEGSLPASDKPIWMDPYASNSTIFLTIEDGQIQQIGTLSKDDRSRPSDHTIPLDLSKSYPGDTAEERAQAELRDIGSRVENYAKEHPGVATIRVEMSPEAYRLMARTVNQCATMEKQVDALNDLMGRPARDRSSAASIEHRSDDEGDRQTAEREAKTAADPSPRLPVAIDDREDKVNERPPAGAQTRRGRV